MGKKKYNAKARTVVNTVIDDSKKIAVDFEVSGNYDESNPLILPSKKRKTKVKTKNLQPVKLLSKKRRKHLEKIVATKNKKENRANLLKSLSEVQASPEVLQQLTSLSTVQTKGLKRFFQESERIHEETNDEPQERKINSLRGAKRRRIALSENKPNSNDPNVVGFHSSDSEDNLDEPEETNERLEEQNLQLELENHTNSNEDEVVIKPEVVEQIDLIQEEKEQKVDKPKEKPRGKPAVFIPVDRSTKIQNARLKLPILAEEQQIMEAINENPIVIIAGETGSGKTTQVPQFLYEAGYATKKLIGVTEPRRVAATAMSNRVGIEMNLPKRVSYLIRFEGNVNDETKIKFMTDGVLLKEIQSDFLLSKYSVIILDEAHERSVYTDILIGLLSRIVPMRIKKGDPLKLIIMSATLRLEDFTSNTRLFKTTPPVLKVEARQFPVTVHFNKRTRLDYVTEAFKKALKIHTTLPDGGILIFVTGQQEVKTLVRKLRRACPLRQQHAKRDVTSSEDEEEDLKQTLKKRKRIPPKIDLDDYSLPGDNEINSEEEITDDEDVTICAGARPMWVLPLYSLLPSHAQSRVFDAPPPDCRLCVVSTNVAETSLTIPHIKYVVDCGKSKMKLYDKVTGVVSYVVTWSSKASANQRAGRAGRTAPGHCYRLYSSAIFNDIFPEYDQPEIQRKPVDDLYLQMKCMRIIKIANFPFPTTPDLLQLNTAEKRLEILGALEHNKPTQLGEAISKFPVLPRFGKMLALSHQHNLLPYTVCLIASLSVQEVLLERPLSDKIEHKEMRKAWSGIRRKWAGVGNSFLLGDLMVLLKAIGASEYAHSQGTLDQFCLENGLRQKAVVEIRKLRLQLTNEIQMNVPGANLCVDPRMTPPNDIHAKLLRQIVLAGMGDQVARKLQADEIKDEDKIKMKYAYKANNMEEPVFLHQGSVLRSSPPDYVTYQEIYETNKMYMRGVTAIEPEWLPVYVPSLCNLCAPLSDPSPRFDTPTGQVMCTVNGSFGTQGWELPNVEIIYPKTIDVYKWFARFLLEGVIYPKLKKFTSLLLVQPGVMIKQWMRLQPRAVALLKALQYHDVTSRQKLEDVWKENSKYLLVEYLRLLPESTHNDVALLWPPLDVT